MIIIISDFVKRAIVVVLIRVGLPELIRLQTQKIKHFPESLGWNKANDLDVEVTESYGESKKDSKGVVDGSLVLARPSSHSSPVAL